MSPKLMAVDPILEQVSREGARFGAIPVGPGEGAHRDEVKKEGIKTVAETLPSHRQQADRRAETFATQPAGEVPHQARRKLRQPLSLSWAEAEPYEGTPPR